MRHETRAHAASASVAELLLVLDVDDEYRRIFSARRTDFHLVQDGIFVQMFPFREEPRNPR
jgi:hypothetical protein